MRPSCHRERETERVPPWENRSIGGARDRRCGFAKGCGRDTKHTQPTGRQPRMLRRPPRSRREMAGTDGILHRSGPTRRAPGSQSRRPGGRLDSVSAKYKTKGRWSDAPVASNGEKDLFLEESSRDYCGRPPNLRKENSSRLESTCRSIPKVRTGYG